MPKKKKSENLQIVNFRMTPEEIERMDRLADKLGKTRSQYLRSSILLGIEEDEAFEKVGLLRAALTVKKIYDWMGSTAKSFSEDIDNKSKNEA